MIDIMTVWAFGPILCLLGFYGAYLYGHKTKRFRWSEYIAIVIWPLAIMVILGLFVNKNFFLLFILSAIFGTAFEYFFGLLYHKTLNRKLWEYKKLSIKGYTSILSIPVWGVAGVFFWSIGSLLNL